MKRNSLTLSLILCWLIGCASAPTAERRLYDPLILDQVAEFVRTTEKPQTPVVVFDLDDTIFDARSRTLPILHELAHDPILRDHPQAAKRLSEAKLEDLRYELDRTFSALGIEDAVALEKAKTYWAPRFFSDKYCAADTPIPGAVAYLNWLHQLGARIVYFSGRDVLRMQRGTLLSLKKSGFPTGKRTELVLKPRPDVDDYAFKLGAMEKIQKLGRVTAAFENEPKNLNALGEAFPKAVLVFLDTRHSQAPDVPTAEAHWVKDFFPVPADESLSLEH